MQYEIAEPTTLPDHAHAADHEHAAMDGTAAAAAPWTGTYVAAWVYNFLSTMLH